MVSKRFCCSNQAQTVAITLGIIDIVCASVLFVLIITLIYIFLNYPECLRSIVQSSPEKQQDLHRFLSWGSWKQVILLSFPLLGILSNWVMGIVLLYGARKRHLKVLKTWFSLSIITRTISVILFFPGIIFTQEKTMMLLISILDYTYDLYSMWVVKTLIVELRSPRPLRVNPVVVPALDEQEHEQISYVNGNQDEMNLDLEVEYRPLHTLEPLVIA